MLGLDEWEALAAPYQDKPMADARSDLEIRQAEQRPEGNAPRHWREA